MDNSIFDYVKYYRDKSFREIKFNSIDALIYSMLIYIPFMNIKEGTNINTLNNLVSNIKVTGKASKTAAELLSLMANSVRYGNVKLYNLVREYDDVLEFAAVTFRDYEYTFISYQGSIGTLAGWRENLYLALGYPSLSQKRAFNYLKETVKFRDRTIYLGGHSKGGNLALASLMMAPKHIGNRIVKVYNFDGPGFNSEVLKSKEYQNVKDKMVNILPDGSMVGIFLDHEKYNFIKSRNVSVEKHYPNNWLVFGEFFIESEENKSSIALHNKYNSLLSNLSYEEKKIFIDSIFDLVKNKKINSFSDLTKLDKDDFKEIFSKGINLDKEKKKAFVDVIKVLINK